MGDNTEYQSRLCQEGYSFHPTTDNWHGNFNEPEEEWEWVNGERVYKNTGGLVACRLYLQATDRAGNFHPAFVVFRGNDDDGCGKEFNSDDEAREFLCHLPSIIEISWLIAQGFEFW